MQNNSKKEKFVLRTVLHAKDEIDAYILNEIVQLPMQLQVEHVVFFRREKDSKSYEKHFGQMLDLGDLMTKTNDTLRNYEKVQRESMDAFLEKSLKDIDQNITALSHQKR